MKRDCEFVHVSDACTMLANKTRPVSRSTVYRLIKSGEIEAYKGRGRTSNYLIDAASIEAYLSRQAVKPSYDRKRIKELLAA